MRPLETLLSLTNLLAFLVLAVPLPRVVPWMRHLAPIALAIAVAQVLMEGPRWQMVPAYALAGLFFVIWLRRYVTPAGGPAREADQQVCHRPGHRAGRDWAGGLHHFADSARVPLPGPERAIRDWHADLPLGGCGSPGGLHRRSG